MEGVVDISQGRELIEEGVLLEFKTVRDFRQCCIVGGSVIKPAVPDVIIDEVNIAADFRDEVNPEIEVRELIVIIPLDKGTDGEPWRNVRVQPEAVFLSAEGFGADCQVIVGHLGFDGQELVEFHDHCRIDRFFGPVVEITGLEQEVRG